MGEQKELPFPYEYKELKPEEEELIKTTLGSISATYIRLGPKGYLVLKPYKKDAANIYNMPLRPSDVFVASYQRSGTTWTQELVWLIANNFNYEKAAEIPLTHRYPFLDGFMFFEEYTNEESIDTIAKTEENFDREKFSELVSFLAKPVSPLLAAAPLTTPRFIKTHLPMSLLPPKLLGTAKMVYVARDPRDVAVSCYHHAKLFKMYGCQGGFKDFWNLFRRDLFSLTPYFEHVKEAWEKRDDPNMLFLFYEDLSKDLPASIRRVADFFGKQVNEEQMNRLCEHLSIENFKNNKSVNYEDLREVGVLTKGETFIRKGTTWTQELVWLLVNDLDYETAAKIPLTERYPFLELFMYFNKKWQENLLERSEDKEKAQALIEKVAKPVTGRLLAAPSPRFIKTHLPMSLLPPKLLDTAKVVYVARDPRDVAVSCFHHSKLFRVLDFPSPFKDFWNLFTRGLFTDLPFFDHVKEAWECRHHPNMLFLFYEELIQDLPAVIRRIADFLGKDLTDAQMTRLCDHLSFENFKKNESVNFEELREYGVLSPEEVFIRKGKAGGWRGYFDEEMTQQAERWIEDNLRDTDLCFPNLYKCISATYIRLGPKGYLVLKPYKKDAANIYNMPLRPSDVFVASYQRSGTTWTQELVWLIANNFNYEKAAEIPLTHRYPFLDGFMFFEEYTNEESIDTIAKTEENFDREKFSELVSFLAKPVSPLLAAAPLTTPRFIKTHLPMSLLPPKLLGTAKMVYVARDLRDVAVSCYHHAKLFKMYGCQGGFKDFWNLFRGDLFSLTPYFEHVKEAWEKRDDPNMLFLFYEDLSKDLPASIRRVADFFGKQVNEEQMNRLCEHLSIENFKNNKSVNYDDLREVGVLTKGETFIRKGKTGGWRTYFDEEMTQQADRWIEDNLLDTDLRFPHMKH